MMTRDDLEEFFRRDLLMKINTNKLLYALLMQDEQTLSDMRFLVASNRRVGASYIDAYDTAVDDHERNGVLGCVRKDEELRRDEYVTKVSDLRSGKIKVQK